MVMLPVLVVVVVTRSQQHAVIQPATRHGRPEVRTWLSDYAVGAGAEDMGP